MRGVSVLLDEKNLERHFSSCIYLHRFLRDMGRLGFLSFLLLAY